ncbi:unnamed protein product [Diamesa serratosioi]
MVSNRTLAKAATYLAVGGFTSIMWMRFQLQDKIRKQEYFKESMKMLRSHKGAIQVLGEPIKDAGFDIGHPNYADSEKAHFEIKVKGSKERGAFFFWSERIDEKWNITKAELELKNDPEKRLVIKKSNN